MVMLRLVVFAVLNPSSLTLGTPESISPTASPSRVRSVDASVQNRQDLVQYEGGSAGDPPRVPRPEIDGLHLLDHHVPCDLRVVRDGHMIRGSRGALS